MNEKLHSIQLIIQPLQQQRQQHTQQQQRRQLTQQQQRRQQQHIQLQPLQQHIRPQHTQLQQKNIQKLSTMLR